MKALAIILTFFVFSFPALSSEHPVERVGLGGGKALDYQLLFTQTSIPGESMDSFASRLAPRLLAFSQETGFEACGVIATDGERFGATIGTNRSHIACANFNRKVPEGMVSTNETIHSHGTEGRFRANRNDKIMQGELFHGRDFRGTRKTVAGQNVREFSEMDFRSGPGYLATPEGVKHQNGHGTERLVH